MTKYSRSKVELLCSVCNKIYLKDKSEADRNIKLGRESFCSRSCCGKAHINEKLSLKNWGTYDISQHCKNQKDEYTGIRDFLRRAKNRGNQEISVSLKYLLQVWNNQNGICPYSKVQLILPNYKKSGNTPIFTASLDRINSSKGYIEGNVQFISIAMNYLKNSMSHEDMLKILDIIKRS